MFNLTDRNISYIIVSPEKESNTQIDNKFLCDKLCNILYSKGYTILPVTGHYEGSYERSFIAVCGDGNDILRKDAFFLIEEFDQDSIIAKYKGEEQAKKILNNGSEKLLSVAIYDSNTTNKTYLYNGISFSFLEQKRYHFLTGKEQLKKGMIVEFYNNDQWIEKVVENIDVEYERLYKLLIKYNKLRVCME